MVYGSVMKPTKDIREQLRAAIQSDGRSLNSLGKEIGINHSGLSRFVSGRRGISFNTAAKLARYYGLELKPRKEQ